MLFLIVRYIHNACKKTNTANNHGQRFVCKSSPYEARLCAPHHTVYIFSCS